jgi:WhiB family transcriptional regulator, redox-sensing transcriptional regulator
MQVKVTRPPVACWDVEPEVFFGPEDSPADASLFAWEREALAICASCPVRAACLAWALRFPEQHGVVGGLTASQRRAVLAGRRRARVGLSRGDDVRRVA